MAQQRHHQMEQRIDPADGLFVLRGLLVDDAEIGPTPGHWSTAGDAGAVYDVFLLLLSTVMGTPIAWEGQQDGRFVHNIVPSPGPEVGQTGASSSVLLSPRTEDAFHPGRAHLLVLGCMRNPDSVATTAAGIRQAELSADDVELFSRPVLPIMPDDAYEEAQGYEGEPPAVLDHKIVNRRSSTRPRAPSEYLSPAHGSSAIHRTPTSPARTHSDFEACGCRTDSRGPRTPSAPLMPTRMSPPRSTTSSMQRDETRHPLRRLRQGRTYETSPPLHTGSPEHVRFRKRLVGGDRDAVLLLPLGQHLKQQLSAVPVQFHVAECASAAGLTRTQRWPGQAGEHHLENDRLSLRGGWRRARTAAPSGFMSSRGASTVLPRNLTGYRVTTLMVRRSVCSLAGAPPPKRSAHPKAASPSPASGRRSVSEAWSEIS